MKATKPDPVLKALFETADAAGKAAAEAAIPTPMVVVRLANPFDETSPVTHRYPPVMDGVCGFAWITITPGSSKAGYFAKAFWGAHKAYRGGMQIWVSAYGQSMTRKEAYAEKFAEVLRAAGIKAYAGSRMD